MNIQIEIISVVSKTNPTKVPGKTYQSLEVAYRNQTFQNKVEGTKVMSFGASADVFKVLATAQSGEVFSITKEKVGEYWNWVAAAKSDGTASPAVSAPKTTGVSGNSTPKSTYETPEERKIKQVYIVRQSSLSNAIDLLAIGSKTSPKPSDVIDVAKQFEAFVFNLGQVEAPKDMSGFDDLEDDIPL